MEKDSIIKLEYDAWIVETNELFDTTHEELAKEEDIFNENVNYAPQPLIVGAKTVVKGLDEALLNAELDKEYEIEIPPDDAYGARDPKLVELHTKREIMRLPEFRKGDKDPVVGMQISMKGKVGSITAITAGRIRVDFNNKLAGRTLKYKYKVSSAAESLEDKINAIIEIHYGTSENFEIETKEKDTDILIPDTCKYDQRWYLVKHRIVTDLQSFTGMETVKFIEEYKKREEPKPEDAKDGEAKDDKAESDDVSVETSDKPEDEDVTVSIDQEVPEEVTEEVPEEVTEETPKEE
jgi:FKBP-type peptidyl-prolyl cis-trans isomerase 2